jgi:hypothetical protein
VILVLVGAATCVLLALLVATVLDDVSENHTGAGVVPYGSAPFGSEDGWWPDADEPVDLELTERGLVAADLPEAFVLDEGAETWEPS